MITRKYREYVFFSVERKGKTIILTGLKSDGEKEDILLTEELASRVYQSLALAVRYPNG